MRVHDKLVRDRIPAIISASGKRCDVRVLTPEEHAARLTTKLAEETQEFAESGETEELVDVVEVVRAILEERGVSWDAFEQLRLAKREERGGFARRLLLRSVSD